MISKLSFCIPHFPLDGVIADPILYAPGNTLHGPNYDIPDAAWKEKERRHPLVACNRKE